MIKIWKPKHSATVIRLDSVFAHGDGLPCRTIGTTAQTAWAMQPLSLGTGWRGFERPGAVEKVYPTGSEKLTHNEVAGIIGRHRACFANLSSCDSAGGRA